MKTGVATPDNVGIPETQNRSMDTEQLVSALQRIVLRDTNDRYIPGAAGETSAPGM